jgi:peptide/nickel transport system substrate-binding protein
VRRAVARLIDRAALVRDVHQGTAGPLYSIVPAGVAGHNTAFLDTYGARPSKAEASAAPEEEGVTGKVELTPWSTPSRCGPAADQELQAIAGQLDAGLFDADDFTGPFFGEGDVPDNTYDAGTITETLLLRTAARSDRSATDEDCGRFQDIVAEDVPVPPLRQAEQYAVVQDGVHRPEYRLDASTVFRFWELKRD